MLYSKQNDILLKFRKSGPIPTRNIGATREEKNPGISETNHAPKNLGQLHLNDVLKCTIAHATDTPKNAPSGTVSRNQPAATNFELNPDKTVVCAAPTIPPITISRKVMTLFYPFFLLRLRTNDFTATPAFRYSSCRRFWRDTWRRRRPRSLPRPRAARSGKSRNPSNK